MAHNFRNIIVYDHADSPAVAADLALG